VSFDLRAPKIYIDGSCRKNPGGAGGFAARIEYPFGWDLPDELIDYTGYFETNNNRMELRACVFAHEWILEQGEDLSVQHVQIVTDSKYVFNNYHRVVGWSTNGWWNVHGRPLENIDLWKDLLRVRRKLGFRIRVERTRRFGDCYLGLELWKQSFVRSRASWPSGRCSINWKSG
jgi:ribonuclease HI